MSWKSYAERLEKARNLKFSILNKRSFAKQVRLSDIIPFCGESVRIGEGVDVNKKVSFVGFFNEFDDVYGKDCLYVHLFGKKNKENEWMAIRAVQHGAIAVISDYQIEELPCIIVDDVQRALKEISRFYFEDYSGGKIAIAGSIGKTTTKEMVECVLRKRFRTFCTPNNGNVLRFLAFEIQHMPRRTEQFIQEVDESYLNNAADCSYILRPDIAIITNIDKSHLATIGGENAVKNAITEVMSFSPEKGVVLINADDRQSVQMQFRQRVVSVGVENENADYVASSVRSNERSVSFSIRYGGQSVRMHLNCPGEHNIYSAMFAFAVGKEVGMSDRDIQKGLADYRPMTIRQKTIYSLGKTIYVDCFNASAKSIAAALSVLKKMRPRFNGRRIAVLGDIAEIEGYEEETYRQIAYALEESEVEILATYGSASQIIWEYLKKDIQGTHYTSKDDLLSFVKKTIRIGDVVLFKASGIIHLERVVKRAFPIAFFISRLPYEWKALKWLLKTI